MSDLNNVFIQLLDDEIFLPKREKEGDAGYDLRITENVILNPGQRKLISCGFKMAIKQGYEAQVRPRSGIAWKKGVTVLNSPGTIDSGFRGILCVILINTSQEIVELERGERVAQMVFNKIETPELVITESLPESDRGECGFGSTGVK
jgi:dUTP pyrophosphatase